MKAKQQSAYIYIYDIDDSFITDYNQYNILSLLHYDKEWVDYITACRMELYESNHDIVYDRMADNTYNELSDALENYYLGRSSLAAVLMTIRQRNNEYDQYCFKTQKVIDIIENYRIDCQIIGGMLV